MSVGVDAGSDSKKNILCNATLFSFGIYGIKLAYVVNNEVANAHIHSIFYISLCLVIAVEINAFCGESCYLCRVKLTARNAVDAKAFLCGNLVDLYKAECL